MLTKYQIKSRNQIKDIGWCFLVELITEKPERRCDRASLLFSNNRALPRYSRALPHYGKDLLPHLERQLRSVWAWIGFWNAWWMPSWPLLKPFEASSRHSGALPKPCRAWGSYLGSAVQMPSVAFPSTSVPKVSSNNCALHSTKGKKRRRSGAPTMTVQH